MEKFKKGFVFTAGKDFAKVIILNKHEGIVTALRIKESFLKKDVDVMNKAYQFTPIIGSFSQGEVHQFLGMLTETEMTRLNKYLSEILEIKLSLDVTLIGEEIKTFIEEIQQRFNERKAQEIADDTSLRTAEAVRKALIKMHLHNKLGLDNEQEFTLEELQELEQDELKEQAREEVMTDVEALPVKTISLKEVVKGIEKRQKDESLDRSIVELEKSKGTFGPMSQWTDSAKSLFTQEYVAASRKKDVIEKYGVNAGTASNNVKLWKKQFNI